MKFENQKSNSSSDDVSANDSQDDSKELLKNITVYSSNKITDAQREHGNVFLKNQRYDYLERLSMRGIVFFVVVAFAIAFLAVGLRVSYKFIKTTINFKHEVISIITTSSPMDTSVISEEGPEFINKTTKETPLTNIRELLPIGSVITVIAFMLGVGLTLLLTIIKAFFSDGKPTVESNKTIAADIATPFSKLIEALVNYITKKTK